MKKESRPAGNGENAADKASGNPAGLYAKILAHLEQVVFPVEAAGASPR
jgi:hypothetical protein